MKSGRGKPRKETAYIIHPEVRAGKDTARGSVRRLEEMLEEAEGLARAIDLDVLEMHDVRVSRIHPGAFFGEGQRRNFASEIEVLKPDIVIVNYALSPVQQRNLEKEFQAKVIDRTGLILEIFGARAQTKEGRLQVELAALAYQKSRLVRSWTHLERQRGGAGFMGGPGETQIELDRRMIDEKIVRLRRDLEDVRRTRHLARKSRERVPFPVVSLVGYTNAGKSTLFNTLTKARVLAKDLLFATLDPTMRRLKMPGGQVVILADTVGFIADLPTHLIEAFRATLEQIDYADVILHVIDVSRPDAREQSQDVQKVLADLGIEYAADKRIVEVWNKSDLLEAGARKALKARAERSGRTVLVSATKGQGLKDLIAEIADVMGRDRKTVSLIVPPEDGKALAWLYRNAEILQRKDSEKGAALKIRIAPAEWEKFTAGFPYREKKPVSRKRRT